MKTATFFCPECHYTQKTSAENAGNEYSCPSCGTVALAILDDPSATPPPPKIDANLDIKGKIASAMGSAKDAASKAASSANTFLASATEKTRESITAADAKGKISRTVSSALSSASTAVNSVAEQAKARVNTVAAPKAVNTGQSEPVQDEKAPQPVETSVEPPVQQAVVAQPAAQSVEPPVQQVVVEQPAPNPAPSQQSMVEKQSVALLTATIYRKNLGIGLILTFFFGGLGTLYASVGWGIFFAIIELILGALLLFTFGLLMPVVFVFHLICLVFTAISISNHNKRLVKALGVF